MARSAAGNRRSKTNTHGSTVDGGGSMRDTGQKLRITIIDGQGGGIGKQLVSAIRANCAEAIITAVGTNSIATSAMLKAGADNAATGENAVVVACRNADFVIGPIGIVIADSLCGEITPAMAVAVGQSQARRILIPVNHCDNVVVGVPDLSVGRLIQCVVESLKGDS